MGCKIFVIRQFIRQLNPYSSDIQFSKIVLKHQANEPLIKFPGLRSALCMDCLRYNYAKK